MLEVTLDNRRLKSSLNSFWRYSTTNNNEDFCMQSIS